MCSVNIDRIKNKDKLYIEKILLEFRIKQWALSSIKYFLNRCYALLNSQLIKLISGFLSNAVVFFIPQDKKEILKIFKYTFPTEFQIMKSDLYECLTNLHPSLYSTKFFHLLHSTTDDIIAETNIFPNLWERYISREDDCFLESNSLIMKGQKWVPKMLMNENPYDESHITLIRIENSLLDSAS